MIFDAINYIALFSLNFLINALPNTPESITNNLSNFISGFVYVFNYINWFLPMGAILQVLAMIFIVENAFFGVNILARILKVLSLGFVDFT